MKKKYFIVALCLAMLSLIGCNTPSNNKPEKPETESAVEAEEQVIVINDNSDIKQNSMLVNLTLVNVCGADIGMFSMIDPVTDEQLNLTPLKDQESATVEIYWPKDKTEFKWALYDNLGELYMEATSDLTGITKSAIIVLSGDKNVDDIDVNVE